MTETQLQRNICKWIQYQFQDVIYLSDFYTFMPQKLRFSLSSMRKKSLPDLFIANPNKEHSGLFIELKKDGEKLYKKDGSYASEHIREQFEMRDRLWALGYCSEICVGFDKATQIISEYLNQK